MITLRQFMEMLSSLPDQVLNKPLSYLDIGNMDQQGLDNLKRNLMESDNEWIQECEN